MPEASIGWIAIIKWIGWIAIIRWIWTQVKRPFSYMVQSSPDSQVVGNMDASASLPRLPAVVPLNQETTVVPADPMNEVLVLFEPSSSSCLPSSPDNQVLGDLDASASLPSSSSKSEWKYDVFLSFRGPDTRKGFTVDIYDGLSRRGIRTFMDDPDLQVGDAISPTLIAAIKESRFAIVILSQNYASSAWCLEELREICQSMEDNRILPLFYHVDPTDVRFQKHSFGDAFTHHEASGRHKSKKVKQWRDALNKVANFSGWNTQQYKTHKELVNVIIEYVCMKVVPDAIESTGDFEVFEATRQALVEIVNALKDDEVTAVGVYGMRGVGKTTLVEHVGAQAQKTGIFDYVTNCVVSQNPDFKNLQDTLAEQLGFRLHENTEIGRVARLSKEIKRRKNILIILDDIWERMDLSRIGIPTYKELQKCNSKVLLTTRTWTVCHQIKCQRNITLNVLSEQDSWALFARKARMSFESPTFEDVAKKVAKECKGLLISLITVARALEDKDLVEWKRAAQRLMKSQTANPDDKEEVYKCIKLSYDYLKDQESKSYFLLCCLFIEDHEINKEVLFRYAIGKGLFRDADTLQEARERAESLARHLQYSCLLLECEDDGFLRMHDVVRDAAIQIAQSEDRFLVKAGCGLQDWPRQLHEGCSTISLMNNDISFPMASSSQEASASLTSSNPCWKYDVFLSFRGPDTRKGITVDIYDGLNRRGIRTFMDDSDLQVGDAISSTLIAAIKESRFAIVVLSQNYASSTWCLEELREICLSMEDKRILPLFYQLDPTDVRYQKRSFEEAFSSHETSRRHKSEKVKQWRDALNKVANLSGWDTQRNKTHKDLVEVIVEYVCTKVVPDTIESTTDFQEFEVTRQAMYEVMEAFNDDKVAAIGVYGMGGVGKTTLVEHVGAQARASGIFNYVTKSVVSQNTDFEKVQNTLAEQLGFELPEKTEVGRAARLRKEIRKREKILLILDDIWERLDLSRIGIPTYKELQKCNSKVLLTTRIWNICHQMECQRKITLNVLSEQDSWALFARKARRSFKLPTFEGVAKKVAGECRGLPIALITIARALGDKDLVEWKRAAQRLQKSQTANPDDKGEVFECIKLSYDYLKDEEYKSYFLLCCVFPEDDEIQIEDLFRYAIGKGLFQDADTLQEARERAESLARHLQCSCLLLESKDDGFLRMHDVVRDAAIQIAQSEEGFLVKVGCGLQDWPRQLHEGYSAISLMRNHIRKLPEKLVCPKLQILILNNNHFLGEIPEAFFQSTIEVRVLDLSWTGISSLPQSFNLLTNLKALYLEGCYITDTSILGKLERLEILGMRYTQLKELSKEIGGLTNLRIFDNTFGTIQRIPPKVISALHSLEELYIDGFRNWGSKVEGAGEETDASFDEVTTLSKLSVLRIAFSDVKCIPKYVELKTNLVEFNIRIGDLYYCRYYDNSIYLELDTISHLPKWFCNKIMKIAERLWWHGCQRLIDIFVGSEHGRLQRLKHLDIEGSERRSITKVDLTITWVPKTPVFKNLEELYLRKLDCAELYAVEFLPPGSLFNLKVLDIEFCCNWGNILLPSTLLERLPNLEKLHFQSTDGGKYMFGNEAFLFVRQLKLKRISLMNLATTRICEGPAPPVMFQDLQILSIKGCDLEGSLFTYEVALHLPQLNCLQLIRCPMLERIVEASNKKTILPKLKELRLIKLPMLYYESSTFDLECPSLERFRFENCPKFSASSSDFHSRKQVQLERWWYGED